ncbi:MAG TPA: NAD-dependent epimerase/dehydratase family protein [Desulfobacterales bacterium]|nr:NAD-dependent epimerase/dehydratase family protein [Desulfobacterales bacterium]HIP40251.1 NAD-dependent epimerase/dehydratase family protein [Desulfocapsa sulfexigens]
MTDPSRENILVVGATGFLGPALVEELTVAGFRVVCGVRNLQKAESQLNFSGVSFLEVNLNTDLDSDVWLFRLQKHKIDRVINNVGIATSFGAQSLENVNVLAPLALFRAMQSYLMNPEFSGNHSPNIPRVIQISTTGVDWPDCCDFPYPASKLQMDEQLAELKNLPYVIIRPNVIYEPERGHLLLEQIARMPINFFIGEEYIQPVHCREIAIGATRLFRKNNKVCNTILRATGPTPMTWKEIFKTASAALDKEYFCSCSVPLKLAQLVTILIQLLPTKLLIKFGILSKMDPEAMVMMTRGSTGCNSDWLRATRLLPIHLHECYREYGKGAEAYSDFIEKIRLTTT